MDTTPSHLLALLRPLFLDSAMLRFLSDTEPECFRRRTASDTHRLRA